MNNQGQGADQKEDYLDKGTFASTPSSPYPTQ